MVVLVRSCRNFGRIRIVVFMLLVLTMTYLLVCPRTMPCFRPCFGWLMMFTLLLVGKSVGMLVGVSMVGDSMVGELVGRFVEGLAVRVLVGLVGMVLLIVDCCVSFVVIN